MFLYIYLYGKIAYTLTKCEWVIGTGSATRHVNNIKNDGNHNKSSKNFSIFSSKYFSQIFQNQPLKVVSLLNQVLKVQIDPLLNPMNQNLKQTILGLQTLDVLLLV